MLTAVERSALQLAAALTELERASYQLSDGSAPLAIPHIQWLDQFVSQAAAGQAAPDVKLDDLSLLAAHDGKMHFLERVCVVEAAATEALKRLDPKLLKHPPGKASIPALRTLVGMAKPIWKSLTGRKPSANKVEAKDRENNVPDFTIFVQQLAEIAGGPIPSFKQVSVAFKAPRLGRVFSG